MIGSNGVVFSVARVDSAWRRRVGSVVRKPASCRVNKHNLEGLAVVWRGLPCLAELPYSAGHARVLWVCRSGGVWNTGLGAGLSTETAPPPPVSSKGQKIYLRQTRTLLDLTKKESLGVLIRDLHGC